MEKEKNLAGQIEALSFSLFDTPKGQILLKDSAEDWFILNYG